MDYKNPTKNMITYELWRNNTEDFGHFTIKIKQYENVENPYRNGKFILEWISTLPKGAEPGETIHNDDGTLEWYGFRINIETHDLDELALCQKAIKKIFKPFCRKTRGFTPREILGVLAKMRNCHHVVYDPRISWDVKASEVMPQDYMAYRDDYTATGHNSCMVSCLARNNDEAKALLLQKFAMHLQEEWDKARTSERFSAWIAKGQPVKNLSNGYGHQAPKIESIAKMLGDLM